MDIIELSRIVNDSQAKEFEANKRMAELKIKFIEKINNRLDQDEDLSVEEMREMTNLLKELNNN